MVINALDNEEARKHVNNMCFNLDIPLVDSGTNGYKGHVNKIKVNEFSVFLLSKARLLAINVLRGQKIRVSPFVQSVRNQKNSFIVSFGPRLFMKVSLGQKSSQTILLRILLLKSEGLILLRTYLTLHKLSLIESLVKKFKF